uniref:Uncharacterized protein n=1 Tax=Timema cristinae TaxID=61476 RepID=A0A7R9DAF3_TIMCR|nr:unnamed protein product [Timema cristinae]
MKSPLNGFLPIKEEIKDESNASDYVEEIVNTEMKSYDSSQEMIGSTSYHCMLDNKAKITSHTNLAPVDSFQQDRLYDTSWHCLKCDWIEDLSSHFQKKLKAICMSVHCTLPAMFGKPVV